MADIAILALFLAYLVWKEKKTHDIIRDILASKISPEKFEEILFPSKEEQLIQSSEPLIDEVPAEEILEKLEGQQENNE